MSLGALWAGKWPKLASMPLPRLNGSKYGNVSIGLTALPLPTNSLSPRETFALQNMSAGKLYWGSDSAVTILTGFPVTPNISIDYGGPVFVVSDTAAQDVRYFVLY